MLHNEPILLFSYHNKNLKGTLLKFFLINKKNKKKTCNTDYIQNYLLHGDFGVDDMTLL